MKSLKALKSFIIVFIFLIIFSSFSKSQEKIIRYQRYEEPQEVTNYFAVGGEYSVDGEVFTGHAGLIIDFRLSSTFYLTAEGFAETEDFKKYSFNVGGLLNMKLADEGIVPIMGAGISLNIPTSATLSTELVLKGNLGVVIDTDIRFVFFYSTPVDHPFEYSYVGATLGIQI